MSEKEIYEVDVDADSRDPDEIPIRDRRVFTQPYDLVVESLMTQINSGTIHLRPLSERPKFQRRYVWTNSLASKLIESILLNVPIPPCYLSQNENFELDVIDGQQRLFSIYRFVENQFRLGSLEVLTELNGLRFFEIPPKAQRQIMTHTLRCVAITNESHPEIKFDVFQRLNTNTAPLNAQELRNCVYRGALNDLLHEAAEYRPWLEILGRKTVDKRMRDEELILRFFAFKTEGVAAYRTPLKNWLNEVARAGRNYPDGTIQRLRESWETCVDVSLTLFEPRECFRREQSKALNRALFDLIMESAGRIGTTERAFLIRRDFRDRYANLLKNEEFRDLIGRAVDHTKRTKRRFEMWSDAFGGLY